MTRNIAIASDINCPAKVLLIRHLSPDLPVRFI
jgi:hypothetical protein